MEFWIDSYGKTLKDTRVAVVGSPGFRSIGELVVDQLIRLSEAELKAELGSSHLPVSYQTIPSYAAHPNLPGDGGVRVEDGKFDFPKVQFYASSSPALLLTRGYHPNFKGQYSVAKKVLDFLIKSGVKRVFVVAGYGSREVKICCAATNKHLLNVMREEYGITVEYTGPFYGFSGLVFGVAKRKGIEAISLFAGSEAIVDEPQFPDEEAASLLLQKLTRILNLHLEKQSDG